MSIQSPLMQSLLSRARELRRRGGTIGTNRLQHKRLPGALQLKNGYSQILLLCMRLRFTALMCRGAEPWRGHGRHGQAAAEGLLGAL